MAVIESTTGTALTISPDDGQALFDVERRGQHYAAAGVTGTMAAALGAGAPVFAARLDPGSAVNAYIERVRISFTTLVAYTVPITVGRRLELYRGSGAATTGGASIAAAARKLSASGASQMDVAEGGDIRIATTATLGIAGITFETVPFAVMNLVHVGAAGAFAEQAWEFAGAKSHPLVLAPGQLIAVRTPIAMDAAGTWQLGANLEWVER